MNTKTIAYTVIATCALMVAVASAAEPEIRTLAPQASAAPATLADFKGLVGNWIGPLGAAGFSAPLAGQIVGHLLLLGDDKTTRVQEMWLIRQEGAQVVVHQKHYTPDLKDREGPNQWGERRVVAIDSHHIYLENLTWVTDRDNLRLLVQIPGRNGAPAARLAFSFKRVKP